MNINKMLLIRPRIQLVDYGNIVPPLNLGYLAASLLQNGFETEIIDQVARNLSIQDLLRIIKDRSPGAIGFSVFTPEAASVFNDLREIKGIYPGVKTVLGGPHPSALAIETMRECPYVDVVVEGEGERTIAVLMETWRKGGDLSCVKGICYRSDEGIKRNTPMAPMENLDQLPFPAYDLMDMDKYIYFQKGFVGQRYMNMITSRGCPFECTFCSNAVFGQRVRFRSADNVLQEIQLLYEKYGVRALSFLDDSFTVNKNRAAQICDRIISAGLDIHWGCMSVVNAVDPVLLKKMRMAGCRKISYGVETGSPELLKNIKKSITLGQVKDAFRMTREADISALAFFVLGLPGETRETLAATRKFAMEIKADYVSVSVLCPLPGSEIFAKNQASMPRDWAAYQLTPFNELPAISITGFSVNELQKELKRFYRSFYLRPGYVFGILKTLRRWGELVFYIKKAFHAGKYWFN